MSVAEVPEGGAFIVKRVAIGGETGKRLADMGFTGGAEGMVIRRGLFRGPLHVLIRGYALLIRRSEAAAIEIMRAGEATT